jgi:hypothetical protein
MPTNTLESQRHEFLSLNESFALPDLTDCQNHRANYYSQQTNQYTKNNRIIEGIHCDAYHSDTE